MNVNSPENKREDASSFNPPLDDASFEAFFKQHFLSLCAYCQFKFGLDADMAKEVVHTGFIKLWDAREHLTAGVSPKSYLYKIITNNILDLLKHKKVKQQYAQFMLQSVHSTAGVSSFVDIDVKQLQ